MSEQSVNFVTIFMGIFLEAVPFLLAGALASGFVEVYLRRERLAWMKSRHFAINVAAGALLGLAVPVCECGVIPLTRRLFRKGLPAAAGISFIVAAPVMNPIAIASTWAAFGAGRVLALRILLTLAVTALTAWVVTRFGGELGVEDGSAACGHGGASAAAGAGGVRRALACAGDDFMDMARYLIVGALLASVLQTFVPRSAILGIGRGPLASVLALETLAFVLSICSTVDAFIALALSGTFSLGAIVAFLVFGPMVDIKSLLMLLGVFRRRAVAAIVISAFVFTTLLAAAVNLLGV